jgi:hypothetical protein
VGTSVRAIEVAGSIDERCQLHLDEPLPATSPGPVRVIILVPQETWDGEREWLRAVAANPAFDVLKEPKEDIYSPTDGKPLRDEG